MIRTICVALLLMVLVVAGLAQAAGEGGWALPRTLFGGGGGPAAGNSNLSLTGSLGQPVIGVANGGETVLHGGFWHSSSTKVYRSYLLTMYENK